MSTPPNPSAEEMLTGIIEAQIAGGFAEYSRILAVPGSLRVADKLVYFRARAVNGVVADHCRSVLDVLLDPGGLRAAYSNGRVAEGEARTAPTPEGLWIDRGKEAACSILAAWLASDGDAAETIGAAYGLLPER